MTHDDLGLQPLWQHLSPRLNALPGLSPVRRAAADAEQRSAVESRLGASMPPDLHDWWSLDDMSADFWIHADGDVFAPVDLDDAVEIREIWLQVSDDEGPPGVDENGEPEPRFHPHYLPFTQSPGGDGLIVDLRPGTSYGAVFLWDHEQWGLGEPLWPSITAMLQHTAATLATDGNNPPPPDEPFTSPPPAVTVRP